MTLRGWLALGAALLALLLALQFWRNRGGQEGGPASAEEALFTGKEPKRKARLLFPAADKPGFVEEQVEIYATASKAAQAKQILRLLFAGPTKPGGASAFPPGWRYREVFITAQGLAVVDLDPEGVLAHPGGTTAEYQSVHTMLKSITDNFKEVRRVQFLVGGEARESLAGHMDVSEPLSPADL